MANKPFDYTIINPLERPKSADLNQMQGQAHADVRLLARQLFKSPSTSTGAEGFVNDSFKAIPFLGTFGFKFTQGIGFQNGTVNTSIGGISGLNDEYTYKPLTIDDREVTFPAGYECASGNYRLDLVQVRALSGATGSTEQLTNQISTDILNPSSQSFTAQDKFKTLTFDLTGTDIQYMNAGDIATAPIVIVKGVEVSSGSAAPPAVSSGYLAVAYLAIFDTASPLSLSQFVDYRTQLYAGVNLDSSANTGVLPVTSGGTGRASLTNNALLSGNGFGAVNLIPTGLDRQVLMSLGGEWQAQTIYSYYTKSSGATLNTYVLPRDNWVEFDAITLPLETFHTGIMRISIQPSINTTQAAPGLFYYDKPGPTSAAILSFYLKVEITGTTTGGMGITYPFVYTFYPLLASNDWYPAVSIAKPIVAGTYQVKVYGGYSADVPVVCNAYINNFDLHVSQG